MTISHCEGALRAAQHRPVLSGDLDATGWAAVMAAKWPGRSPSMSRRIFRNKSLATATSASWKVTYRPCLTTFAPILTSFYRGVVSDQCSTSFGKARVRIKLARL